MTKTPLIQDLYLTLMGMLKSILFLKRSCLWPKKKIERYQFNKLKTLLQECHKNVPYYRDLFEEIGFDPSTDFKSLTDLNRIPILTKAKAREVRALLDNPNYVKKSITMRTSGSTGEPFQVNVSHNAWIMEQAVIWRHWGWSGYRFRDKMAIVRSYVPEDGSPLIKKDRLRNFIYFSPFHLNDENMSFYLNEMIAMKIRVLRGYPSSILALANYIHKTNHSFPKLKQILVASELLTSKDRSIIEEAFGVKVTNHYGLAEVCVMMGDCHAHNGLHNYDEYGYVEFLDTDEDDVKQIIGTNLHNFATPLLRYETGDLAKISDDDGVGCEHNLTTVSNILGRKDQYIFTPENYKVPTVNFYTMFEKFQDVEKWQIIQKSLEQLEVIIKSDVITTERIEELRKSFYLRLPETMEIDINLNQPFVQKYEGKINTFISMLI